MIANNGTAATPPKPIPWRDLVDRWWWRLCPPPTTAAGSFNGAIPVAEIQAGCLMRIMDSVASIATRPATPPPAVVEELRAIRALVTPPKPPPAPDPAAEKAARERDSRGRAWAAYVKAGGSGDPGEVLPHVPPLAWEATPIGDACAFSMRVHNALGREGVTTFGELCRLTADDLLCFRNFGRTALREVVGVLDSRGLKLKGDA